MAKFSYIINHLVFTPMTRDNLDTNIIAHVSFMLCYIPWTSLIRLKTYINSTYEYQINEEALHIKQYVVCIISVKDDCL